MVRRVLGALVVLLLGTSLSMVSPLYASAFVMDSVALRVAAKTVGKIAVKQMTPVRMLANLTPWGVGINAALLVGTIAWEVSKIDPPPWEGWYGDEATKPPGVDYAKLQVSPEGVQASKDATAGPVAGPNGYVVDALYCTLVGTVGGWTATSMQIMDYQVTARNGAQAMNCGAGGGVVTATGWLGQIVDVRTGQGLGEHYLEVLRKPADYVQPYVIGVGEMSKAVIFRDMGISAEFLGLTSVRRASQNEACSFSGCAAAGPYASPLEIDAPSPADVFTAVRYCSDGTTREAIGTGDEIAVPHRCPEGALTEKLDVFYKGKLAQSSGYDPAMQAQAVESYANCVTAGGIPNGACELGVMVDGRPCTYGTPGCADWYRTSEAQPERVKCLWGIYSMPMGDCEALRHGYVTRSGTAIKYAADVTNPGTNPARDPAVSPAPSVDPNGTPWPENAPIPTGDPNPVTDPVPYPRPETENCWAGMASWNPIDWIYTPVKCALIYAFVPPMEDRADFFTAMDARWHGSTPGQWADALSGYAAAFQTGGMGGCLGPSITLGPPLVDPPTTLNPFSTCEQPVKGYSVMVRQGLTVLLIAMGAFTSVRYVLTGIGYTGVSSGSGDE